MLKLKNYKEIKRKKFVPEWLNHSIGPWSSQAFRMVHPSPIVNSKDSLSTYVVSLRGWSTTPNTPNQFSSLFFFFLYIYRIQFRIFLRRYREGI